MGAKGQPKTGGRAKGTPNRKTQEVIEKALALGRDPLEILILFANRKWEELDLDSKEEISPELMEKSAKDATEYIHAKRKAIELTGKDGGPLDIYLSMPEEERARRRKELEAMLSK